MSKNFSFIFAAALPVSPVVGTASFAQTQVEISQYAVQSLVRNRAGAASATALQSFVGTMRSAKPSISNLATEIGAEVAAAYLTSVSQAPLRARFFRQLLRLRGLQTMVTAMSNVSVSVSSDQRINSTAIDGARSVS